MLYKRSSDLTALSFSCGSLGSCLFQPPEKLLPEKPQIARILWQIKLSIGMLLNLHYFLYKMTKFCNGYKHIYLNKAIWIDDRVYAGPFALVEYSSSAECAPGRHRFCSLVAGVHLPSQKRKVYSLQQPGYKATELPVGLPVWAMELNMEYSWNWLVYLRWLWLVFWASWLT